jgi:hypothetical protein
MLKICAIPPALRSVLILPGMTRMDFTTIDGVRHAVKTENLF